jgi:hypothetical protein
MPLRSLLGEAEALALRRWRCSCVRTAVGALAQGFSLDTIQVFQKGVVTVGPILIRKGGDCRGDV